MGKIIEFFDLLFKFIQTLISGIVWAITSLPKMAETFVSVFAFAPPFLSVFLTLCLTITITYAVIKLL